MPTLRAFGNLCAKSDKITEFAVKLGIIPYIKNLLKHKNKPIVQESAWCLSNIAAGPDN